MGFQFQGIPNLRVAPMQMRPTPVPIGTVSRLPVQVPMAPNTSTIIGPGRLLPTQSLTQPTISGALPSRLSPSSVTQSVTSQTTNGLTYVRPGVLGPGQTNVPTVTTPTVTNPVTVNPGIPGRPIIPTQTTTVPTPVYTQPQTQQPGLWDRLFGGSTPTVAVTPNGVNLGLTTAPQAVQYTPQGTLVQPQTVYPGRTTPTQTYQPTNPGVGYISAAQPNGQCLSYRDGFVGFFDSTMGAFLRKITGTRENCWGGQQTVNNTAIPQSTVPGATTNTNGLRVNPQFMNNPAMPAPGTVQNGVPITTTNPSVFQR